MKEQLTEADAKKRNGGFEKMLKDALGDELMPHFDANTKKFTKVEVCSLFFRLFLIYFL